MKKKVYIGGVVLVLAVVGAGLFGLFPVARIDTSVIWYREFDTRAGALERFEERSRAMTGGKITDADRLALRRSVLQSMIAQTVLEKYIAENLFADGLPAAASAVVEETVTKTADPTLLPRATKELYGWSVDEFKKEVLYPQALQNVLAERIEKDGGSFEEFLDGELKKAQVRLYGVPWKWENGALQDK